MKKNRNHKKIYVMALVIWMVLSMGITRPQNYFLEDDILYVEKIIYTVEAGDSLWKIAESLTSEKEDLRKNIDKIKGDNNLTDNFIKPGNKLVLYKNIYIQE